MSRSRDQGAIDALVAQITADDVKDAPSTPSTNGNGPHHADMGDDEVIEVRRHASNAAKFAELFDDGSTTRYNGDDSRADQALISMLAFCTQDPAQLDRIFRRSALYRADKWGKRDDYRQRTINKALDGLTETYSAPSRDHLRLASSSSPSPSSNDDDDAVDDGVALPKAVPFCEMGEPKEHRDVLAGLIPESYPTVWYGDGGSAKSMLALSLGVAVAGDAKTWLGRAVSTAPVLYADFELDAEEQNRRVRRIVSGAGLPRPPANLVYLPALGYGPATALSAAYTECEERGVKLMILDSFGPAFSGDSEAARDIIGFFGRVMEPFRALGVAVLLIDHQARQQAGESYQKKSAFGSVYKTNLARSVVQIEASERGDDYLDLRLRQKKHNFGKTAEPFGAKVTFGDQVVVEGQDLDQADLAEEGTLNSSDRVRHALQGGPAYPDELVERTGLERGNVSNCLTKLKKAGVVETTGERQGRSEQVRLTSSSSLLLRGDDDDDAKKNRSKTPVSLNATTTDGVISLDSLHGREVEALFEHPPKWLNDQLGAYFKEPGERLLKPLCANIALDLGYTAEQVRPHVEQGVEDDWRNG